MAADQLGYNGELPGQNDEICGVDVPLHSAGLWSASKARNFLNYALPRLQLQLALIFIVTQSFHVLLGRLYMPRIVSEVMAGVILGHTFLGQIPQFTETLFPEEGEVLLDLLSKIGFMFFMFLAGVKMDPGMVTKTGVKAWTIGLSSTVIPVGLGLALSKSVEEQLPFYRRSGIRSVLSTLFFIPFPVISALLVDLKIMSTELGRLALAAALIGDLTSAGATFFVGKFSADCPKFSADCPSHFLLAGSILMDNQKHTGGEASEGILRSFDFRCSAGECHTE
ncbi:hypothetical protein RJ639_003174 [Escallonia herrerae]|uniref:Cation/H+ exchanger transmembrane domain-containing protein n=1 Tax=Escallonia herrerae TaxID=1293975 RepID=A0AA89AZ61_9ASTE|nr:hypothetical protein RJ639_003174 [Escallonia herrerae]